MAKYLFSFPFKEYKSQIKKACGNFFEDIEKRIKMLKDELLQSE